MANLKDSLARIMELDGAIAAMLVDSDSGMVLGTAGGGGAINLEVAAAGNTEVVRAKRKTMRTLGINDVIEDMLLTLGRQYHILRPLRSQDALFFYVVIDKQRGNLAMARVTLATIEGELTL